MPGSRQEYFDADDLVISNLDLRFKSKIGHSLKRQ